jgi:murein DD-endopeptidase MepM/ murein hydrolase activator NlpD
MCLSRLSAFWPQVVAISLIGLGAAGCSDSGRFTNIFASDPPAHPEVTGSVTQRPPASRVVARPLPPLASANTNGYSGGGRGLGSYQPGNGEVTGALRPSPPPPKWTWEGGTPIIVGPGESLETIARLHRVPLAAIMQANNITSPGSVHAGQHLVIPRRLPATAYAPPTGHIATTAPSAPVAPIGAGAAFSPNTGVHVVAPGETLHSIARLYGKSVLVIAKANGIPPDSMVRVGQRIAIPGVRHMARAEPPAVPNPPSEPSPHSAWKVAPVAPPVQQGPVHPSEPVGALPSFRWPVRGRVIAGFGPTPSGAHNDGIDVAVPQGTPIKAAEDGVVAYAGNELKGYGNLVLVRHTNGYVTAYAHASEILVKRGETVRRGQVIAKAGQTGTVKVPELHFEIRKGATPVDPSKFLNGA